MNYELRYGEAGTDVRRLQEFLIQSDEATISPDGVFGPNTRKALIAYQAERGLEPTGHVDQDTFASLASNGLVLLSPAIEGAETDLGWPERPDEPPQPDSTLSAELFGEFEFRHTPVPSNPEKIEILGGWREENIVSVRIPQLDKCLFAAGNRFVLREIGAIECHRLAAGTFEQLFQQWEDAGLADRILTCAGAFNARLKRGATSATRRNLSNHSWGTAIDLNNRENPLGHTPVGVSARGSLRELVAIANGLGFFWGGHFGGRPDGMHFELARL